MVYTFDASWVVPGQILITSDPLTTACDPNPDTFTDVFTPQSPRSPMRSHKEDFEAENRSETTPRLGPGQFYTTHTGWAIGDTDSVRDNENMSPPSEIQSCDTVCKEYSPLSRMDLPGSCCPSSGSFSSFLRSSGICLVVRANFMYEAGMPQASYDAAQLQDRDASGTSTCRCPTLMAVCPLAGTSPGSSNLARAALQAAVVMAWPSTAREASAGVLSLLAAWWWSAMMCVGTHF